MSYTKFETCRCGAAIPAGTGACVKCAATREGPATPPVQSVLTECPACHGPLAADARACPRCGKQAKMHPLVAVIVLVLFGYAVYHFVLADHYLSQAREDLDRARDALHSK